MKKLAAYLTLFLTTIVFIYLSSGGRRVFASTGYARIETDDAVFYADRSLTISRFTLPKSYYVKVLETGGETTRVIYSGSNSAPPCEGYVKTVSISFVTEVPSDLYPEKTITTVVDEVMFSDPDLGRPRSVLAKGTTAIYYGERYANGETYLYVYSSGSVGYVKKTAFEEFTVPLHPVYAAELAKAAASASATDSANDPAIDSGVAEKSETEPSQVIVIAILIIGVLCVVFLVFKREDKRSSANAFFRDDD